MLEFIMRRLNRKDTSLVQVANEAGVHVRWLRYLAAGDIADPSLRLTERLAVYFKFKPSSTRKR